MPDAWDFNQTRSAPPQSDQFPIITYLLIFLCVLFTAADMTGSNANLGAWHRLYLVAESNSADNIWAGQYWIYISSLFVHGGIFHLFCNMSVLYPLGPLMERKLNPFAYIGFIVAAGLVSGGCQVIWTHGEGPGIGFSGVLYAMLGFAWLGRHRHPTWDAVANDRNMKFAVIFAFAMWFATDIHVLSIGNGAHFGGLAFGLGVGWLAYGKSYRLLAMLPTAVVVGIAVMGTFWMPWSGDWLFVKGGQAFDRQKYPLAITYYHRCIARHFEPALSWNNISCAWHNMGVAAYYKRDYNSQIFDEQQANLAVIQKQKFEH